VNDNIIHYFGSKRQAMLLLVMLARTCGTGGQKCFHVETQPDCPEVKNPRTLYRLEFLPAEWRKLNPDTHAEPPTTREMAWFVRGYLRALTGKRVTVL